MAVRMREFVLRWKSLAHDVKPAMVEDNTATKLGPR
jgi:hypothetical protein